MSGLHDTTQSIVNRRILLAARPQSRSSPTDFRLDTQAVPTPHDGQVLLRTLWLPVDPYMRNLMDEVGPGYAPPIAIGAPLVGGTVSRVVATRNPKFSEGELVLAYAGWQDYAVSDGSNPQPLGDLTRPSHALG